MTTNVLIKRKLVSSIELQSISRRFTSIKYKLPRSISMKKIIPRCFSNNGNKRGASGGMVHPKINTSRLRISAIYIKYEVAHEGKISSGLKTVSKDLLEIYKSNAIFLTV